MTAQFSINGKPYAVDLASLPVDITLNTFIREYAGLPATKFMCQEGGCGVCVCAVTGKHPATGEVRTWAVNSCLTLLNSCTDLAITTSEGIGNKRNGYHSIQKRLAKMNGTQCGYCSPGFVMNMYALLQANGDKLTMEEVENSFGGNICRCTGYRPILDAMKSFAVDSNISVPEECRDIEDLTNKVCPKTGNKCGGSCGSAKRTALSYADGSQWYWAKTIGDIFDAFSKLGNVPYTLIAGNTAHGVYRRAHEIQHFIDINGVGVLRGYTLTATSLTLGGNLSLTETMEIFKEAAQKPGFEYCQQLWNHFDLIANVPVRNSGTLAGNLAIKHQHPEFPSDIYIAFEALGVQVILNVSANEQVTISINEFLQTSLEKKIISGFVLRNYPREKYIFGSYKIMPRAQNAHAYVNAGFLVNIEKPSNKVISSRICFGGIDADYVHAVHIEKLLAGKSLFDNQVVSQIFSGLQQSIKADISPPDASPEYRQLLAHGLFYKFLLANAPKVADRLKSGGDLLKRDVSSGKQTFETIGKSFPVTKPIEKHEGLLQTSGEATFANDVPMQANQVWCAYVTAQKVGATVTNIDASEALKLPGVVAFFSAKDIPGSNSIYNGRIRFFFPDDEELLLTGAVKFYNQPIGVIVAESNALANRAAGLVKLSYSGGSSEVLATMKDVLESACAERIKHSAKSPINELKFNSDKVDVTGKGKLDMGLQYHYFMEPQTTVVVPFEGGLQVHCSTQWMDMAQSAIGDLLKMRYNDVQVKTRRVGGGYGGKGTRSLAAACIAALTAYKLNRPARFVQSLPSMMNTLGKRWPCLVDYEFHVQKNGKIVALQSTFWEDGGFNANESPIGHAQLLSKNCYEFSDNFKLDGHVVITDSPTNCSCRAPGSLEGIAMIENIIEHIAFETGLDPLEVRLANLLPGHKMNQMLSHFIESTNYKTRRPQIEAFNEKNRWRKRGMGLCVMEYHMGYFGQYPATVAIYHGDGTVIVSHGGIEMGQGLNTKVVQVIAHDLGIPVELIRIEGSDTLNGANSMTTGGSIGSEQVCFAVRNCCNTLNARLKPVKESMKDASWKQLVEAAYEQKVNLLASDYCKQDDMDPYTVCALGLFEVEVDILTGNYQVSRADILEDAGESLNPSVDIGQIEGAFIMGLGYWTSEQCVVDKRTGKLLTNRTWNYKPPGAKDIPIDFRVELLPNSANTAGFMRSKATGEPAICLSVGVAFALQQALQSARKDAGLQKSWVPLSAPMTPEVVLLNAGHNAGQFKLD